MSWGTELWDQYDNVSTHTLKGIDFLDKYSHFLKERCSIETRYASDLKRLVRNYQPKKKEEDDYQYTWAKSFLDMLKELHDLAGQHEVIAENIQGQLVQEAQKLVQDMKNERRKYLGDGSKVNDQLKKSLSALEKAKDKYERAFKDSEKATDAYLKAEKDINLSRAEVSKARGYSDGKQQEADKAKNEYASQLQTTNQQQNEFYNTQMPQVFQQFQDLDEKRINKIKSMIQESARIEQNVLPIIKTCIEGTLKASDNIDTSVDSKLVIDRYKSGFTKPPDIPFEDLSNGKTNSQNNLNINPDRGTLKGGTIGKKKDRAGLFNIFSKNKPDEQQEDFSNLPPSQQKKKLQKKLDDLNRDIAHETAEREGMLKMQEVYRQNPALGDANGPEILKKINENAQKLNDLQSEYKKFQDYLLEAEGKLQRHGSNSSMTHSITSNSSNVIQSSSAPGTPTPAHNLYDYKRDMGPDPEPEPEFIEPEPGTPDHDDEFQTDFYPVIGTCRALYPFDATNAVNDGSVAIVENEEMFVLEMDQGDGWTRVRKNDQEQSEGFVPTSYIQCHFYDQDAV